MKYIKHSKEGTEIIDNIIPETTMNDYFSLLTTPEDDREAVNREYVDNLATKLDASSVSGGFMTTDSFPYMEGDLFTLEGSGVIQLSDTGVISGTYPKVVVNKGGVITQGDLLGITDIPKFSWNKINNKELPSTLNDYGITDAVSKIDGTITGNVRSNDINILGTDVATKQYVDNKINEGSGFDTGDVVTGEWGETLPGLLEANGSIIDRDTYPYLYSVIGDSFAKVDFGLTSGKPWKQQHRTNLTGYSLGNWGKNNNVLPYKVEGAQALVTKNKVYLIGGVKGGSYKKSIAVADINVDGSIGNWSISPNDLPGKLAYSQLVVTKNRVYLLGGLRKRNEETSVIYTASINDDGTLNSWTTSNYSLPEPITGSQALLTETRMYLLGGSIASGYTNKIYFSNVSSDGTIGEWEEDTNFLPVDIGYSQIVKTEDMVYLIGGIGNSWLSWGSSSIYKAPINPDGTIGTWSSNPNGLPLALYGSQVVINSNRIYLLGGRWFFGNSNIIYTASIGVNKTISSWSSSGSLPVSLSYSQAVITDGKLHLLGGKENSSSNDTYECTLMGGSNDYSSFYNGKKWVEDNPTRFALPELRKDYDKDRKYYIKY